MKKLNVITVVGGVSKTSVNRQLYEALCALDEDLELTRADIEALPFYNQDLELDPPTSVKDFKNLIKDSDAVLFVTPEYNRSFPGILKNAVDWGSRPFGQNLWNKMPAAIIGASMSALGTFAAQAHLRQVLSSLNMRIMAQPEAYITPVNTRHCLSSINFSDDKTKRSLERFLSSFKEWIDFLGEKRSGVHFTGYHSFLEAHYPH